MKVINYILIFIILSIAPSFADNHSDFLVWKENFKNKVLSVDQYYEILINHPILLERPIVTFSNTGIIAKPIDKLANFIKKNSGAAIFFDYGYVDGHGDSFQGIKDNKPINPLSDPGFVDLTSHVNFKDIKLQAKKNNINFYGPNTQSLFLEEMGAIQRLRILERNAKDHRQTLTNKAPQGSR